jgi:hypothetical protein
MYFSSYHFFVLLLGFELLFNLLSLDYLWLNGNDISGSIPEEVCKKREQLSKPSSFYADCLGSDASVKCDCCTDCCYHNMPNAQCYRQDR